MKRFNNLNSRTKLLGGFGIVCVLMLVVALAGVLSLKIVNNQLKTMYQDRLLPNLYLGDTKATLYDINGEVNRYIMFRDERADIQKKITDDFIHIFASIKSYGLSNLSAAERTELDHVMNSLALYQGSITQVIDNVNNGMSTAALESLSASGDVTKTRNDLVGSIEHLTVISQSLAIEMNSQGDSAYTLAIILIIVAALVALLVGLAIGLLITNSFNQPLQTMSTATQNLALGELNNDVTEAVKKMASSRKDEVGILGKGVLGVETYILEMAHVAWQIADGDLSMEVVPRCANDELGNAFAMMIINLRAAIQNVGENANQVASAASELSSAADQAGTATSQIAVTIQQVAIGTSQQAQVLNQTTTSVDHMELSIQAVAKGAEDQAADMVRTSSIIPNIASAIQQVTDNAASSVQKANKAAQTAREGGKIVEETTLGMQVIKEKVNLSVQKVREMGQSSDQIGDIVETIGEIASQTNLLALNAAIEAARAGVHGKGFAVVADEVRKLAEKSSSSTKEITALVRRIQQTVNEAVSTMEESAREVEKGVSRTGQSSKALEAILAEVQAVNQQVEEIASASRAMSALSKDLVGSIETTSAVVEQNTIAAQEMSNSSIEVVQAVENMASISEENSAAVEEVSASTEEVSAQVGEFTSAANSLSALAKELQKVVMQFKLSGDGSEREEVIQMPSDF